ncbi:MAG: phosphodiester glycosidase family protein [Clostridia bacterium]|nr:phosphodiester glycosidase family protein [Clostridia bacterium]
MQKTKRKHPLLRNLIIDLVCTGIALVVFALFHHVLPRQQQSMGIVIANPYQTETNDSGAGLPQPEDGLLIAAAGASDSPSDGMLLARGGWSGGKSGKGGNGMNSKGGSALTDGDAASDAPAADDTPLSEKFADRYTDEVVITDSSYSSPDISITVTEETAADGRITYYLADIYVRDIACFQSALARNTYGSGYRDSITDMAALNDALLAINGDYYGNTNEGVVIRNGVIYRANRTTCDVCVLYYDGTMRVMPGNAFTVEDAIADGAWQAWTFGPALLDTDGSALAAFASTGRIISANPRTAIGYYEPGHYCMIVVDGRGESAGISLPELSQLFYDLGCAAAYNLDGGNSSIMVWQDAVINAPSGGGRESSDALLIAEVNDHE